MEPWSLCPGGGRAPSSLKYLKQYGPYNCTDLAGTGTAVSYHDEPQGESEMLQDNDTTWIRGTSETRSICKGLVLPDPLPPLC